MCSCLVPACKPYRIALVFLLSWLLSGWTCSAIFDFDSCAGDVLVPQITSLSPDTLSVGTTSVLLLVTGTGFVSASTILWNGNPLPTTFVDSHHLQATITQLTFESFGGSTGTTVLISVMSPRSTSVAGCRNGGSSGTLFLVIN
jgi:hypothetical protein